MGAHREQLLKERYGNQPPAYMGPSEEVPPMAFTFFKLKFTLLPLETFLKIFIKKLPKNPPNIFFALFTHRVTHNQTSSLFFLYSYELPF